MRISQIEVTLVASVVVVNVFLTQPALKRAPFTACSCAYSTMVRPEHHRKPLRTQLARLSIVVLVFTHHRKLQRELFECLSLSDILNSGGLKVIAFPVLAEPSCA